ncbi:sigma-70 family RNA polymerase sigma factor [Corynebacterium sp. zg-331]|uniref:sigma-70 family RNA polymerase sigma factor n=1 Tax=unclassified Corynebacterium TaxID=2624378 RepID=UPI00128C5552|nr:sigma-70 family RNA polymerase sigma factor [Corynebacterium sp. zg-331]MPV51638.1 sigma-70 family RNA polymerase sigma factor [Corynebacterium sp. zg331]
MAVRLDVAGALSQLDPRSRVLLIDTYLVGLTQRQIATKHGISQPRVKRLLDQAKAQMRDLLE